MVYFCAAKNPEGMHAVKTICMRKKIISVSKTMELPQAEVQDNLELANLCLS